MLLVSLEVCPLAKTSALRDQENELVFCFHQKLILHILKCLLNYLNFRLYFVVVIYLTSWQGVVRERQTAVCEWMLSLENLFLT